MRYEIIEKQQANINKAYDYLSDFFGDRLINVAAFGSMNYGLASISSDTDIKAMVCPTLNEIIADTKVNAEFEYSGGKITVKDIRLMMKEYQKKNMNFVETLFTNFQRWNPLYSSLLNDMSIFGCYIGNFNYERTFTAAQGQLSSVLKKIDKLEPRSPEWKKQLSRGMFIYEFVVNYSKGKQYDECLQAGDLAKDMKLSPDFFDAFDSGEDKVWITWLQSFRDNMDIEDLVKHRTAYIPATSFQVVDTESRKIVKKAMKILWEERGDARI